MYKPFIFKSLSNVYTSYAKLRHSEYMVLPPKIQHSVRNSPELILDSKRPQLYVCSKNKYWLSKDKRFSDDAMRTVAWWYVKKFIFVSLNFVNVNFFADLQI